MGMIKQATDEGKKFRDHDSFFWAKCQNCNWNIVEYDEESINKAAWRHCVDSGKFIKDSEREEAHEVEIEYASYNKQEGRHLYYQRGLTSSYRYRHGEQYPTHLLPEELEESNGSNRGSSESLHDATNDETERQCGRSEGTGHEKGIGSGFRYLPNREKSASGTKRENPAEDQDCWRGISLHFGTGSVQIVIDNDVGIKNGLETILKQFS